MAKIKIKRKNKRYKFKYKIFSLRPIKKIIKKLK